MTVDKTIHTQTAKAEFRGGVGTEKECVSFQVPECVRYLPLWRENQCAYNAVKKMDGFRRVLGALLDFLDWTVVQGDSVRYDRTDENSRWTMELSGTVFAPLPDCVSKFSGTLGCTVPLPFCVRVVCILDWLLGACDSAEVVPGRRWQ